MESPALGLDMEETGMFVDDGGWVGMEVAPGLDEEGVGGEGDLEDGFVADGSGLLREIADGGAAVECDFAAIGFLVSEDHIDEGGLAGAVGADKAEAFAAIDLQRRVAQQFARSEALGDFNDGQHPKAANLPRKPRRASRNVELQNPAAEITRVFGTSRQP